MGAKVARLCSDGITANDMEEEDDSLAGGTSSGSTGPSVAVLTTGTSV